MHEREGHGPQIESYIRNAIEGPGGLIGLVNSTSLLKKLARTPEAAKEKMKTYYESSCYQWLPRAIELQMLEDKDVNEQKAIKAARRIFDGQIEEITARAAKEGWKPCAK